MLSYSSSYYPSWELRHHHQKHLHHLTFQQLHHAQPLPQQNALFRPAPKRHNEVGPPRQALKTARFLEGLQFQNLEVGRKEYGDLGGSGRPAK